ncbi:MAG: hypothetical protein A2275_18290 [Bacteroidetes bacterium RIFOXYA12_FULL_35_11]|nr:MAG: hypothetical protein A2X01_20855 [Bacteroidetes bacterium GWF2_35_48]OFY82712.1 MAG: hypothetical protein A2275_18290 [Bacteroidetes bacterium RIFOXYA12_FULL_35_11]OFY95040.1 MAG: hypothetical protein A2491_16795 [Bacteroidetes bacterium RIFOXYC12_FULL_35_7]HBX51814.1 transcriptional regulator [Bacteroidales bacterium]
MTNNKTEQFNKQQKEFSAIAKALSHPARIAIIQLLAEKKEIKTGNISDDLPIARTTVSQHLKILKNAGIISGTIDGLKIHYCLDMKKIRKINNCFDKWFSEIITDYKCKC